MKHLHPRDELSFAYHSSGYGPGSSGVDPKLLVGDENVILDFRFSTAPALSWYFDHHVSAFPSPEERAVYEARVAAEELLPPAARRMFHDGTYSSCTKLIADVGAARFGVDPAPMAKLVSWADMIDSAAFPNAEMAVARDEPVLQMMAVVEQKGTDAFLTAMVPRLLDGSLEEMASSNDIQAAYAPIRAPHEAFIALTKDRAVEKDGVVFVDVSDQLIETAGKFVTYALYPKSAYSVLLTRSRGKCKISIGYNPWSPIARRHNIAEICERHGGGGHPVVGAISLLSDEVDKARALAREIVLELAT